MARITVEDCLEHVENRFSLVLITAQRTKQIMQGSTPRVDENTNNKEIVTALREIAGGYIMYREKDPVEVPPEVAAAEVRRVVAARQLQYERMEAVRPPPPTHLDDEDNQDELDDVEDFGADDDDFGGAELDDE